MTRIENILFSSYSLTVKPFIHLALSLMYLYVHACVDECVCAHVRASVCVCVCVRHMVSSNISGEPH